MRMGTVLMDPVNETSKAGTVPDDAELLRAYCERGDREALGTLFSRHQNLAYRVALRCSVNASDAEDAVQAAFLSVLRSAAQYRAESSVRAWIMGVVVYTCKDRAKAERVRSGHQERAAKSILVHASDSDLELRDAALSAVHGLPEHYRLPVWLHFLEGLTFKEAGTVLKLPENTVRSQANRGIEQLRAALASAGHSITAAGLTSTLAVANLESAPPLLTAKLSGIASKGAIGKLAAAGQGAAKAGFAAKAVIASVLTVSIAAGSVALVGKTNRSKTAQPKSAAVEQAPPRETGDPKSENDKKQAESWPAGKTTGWRGDGSGVYPNENPPTTWSRSETGEKKNILWECKLPCYSWATPIIVGEKIFVRSEPYDLICLNKKDGKILWIRSHGPCTAIGDDEKKANPAFNDIAALIGKLNAVNDAYVASGSTPALLKEKHDLQKQINDASGKIDKKYKLPPDMWNESWGGYTGSTPCSDGKFIYFTSGSGVTACYDLDGNKKWSRYERVPDAAWGEHGIAISPALVGDKFLVPQCEFIALNKATGAEIWRQSYKQAGVANEVLPFQAGGTDYAFAYCNLIRVSDGKPVFIGKPERAIGAGVVIHDNEVFYTYGAPGLVGYRFEPKANSELQVSPPLFDDDGGNGVLPLPVEASETGNAGVIPKSYVPAPLFHDGLIYLLSNGGKLVVIDAKKHTAKDAFVYTKFLPFDMKNPKHRHTWGCGICASPALAGKYIFLTDAAGCTIVIEPGREYKQVAKNNINYKLPHGWEENHWDGPREEVTLSTPIFDGNCIFIRGEQNLYCIGETKGK